MPLPLKPGPEVAQHQFFLYSVLLVKASHKVNPKVGVVQETIPPLDEWTGMYIQETEEIGSRYPSKLPTAY